MALTATPVLFGPRFKRRANVVSHLKETMTDFTFDASYPTGGEPFTAKELGLKSIDHVVSSNVRDTAAAGGTVDVCAVDVTENGGKLKANAVAAQVADLASLTTLVVRVVAQGR